jgi:4a-hydroxytetrahydrobiopterin dehydratase
MIYSESAATYKLNEIDNWLYVNNALEKNYVFKNFLSALAFINTVGSISEKLNHHPEIYNLFIKVQLRLNTHDVGGVTDKDFELAKAIDAIA